jgi:phosphoribosylaminoimidazole-succinocarboxamide synthase
MSQDGHLRSRGGDCTLSREDRLTAADRWVRLAYRTRGWLLCRAGRHFWAQLRNPEVGGARAHYELCRRCGRERSAYVSVRDLYGN